MALTDNLVSYYELEESSGTTASDSHSTNDMTYQGNLPTAVSGIINNAQDFDGTGDYISLTSSILGYQDFTIACWVDFDGVASEQRVYTERNDADGNPIIQAYIDASGQPTLRLRGNDGTGITSVSDTALSANTWYFLVFKFDVSTGEMSVSTNAGTPQTATYGGNTFSNVNRTGIGVDIFTPDTEIDGTMDEVGLWNRVITSTEEDDLYNSGNGLAYPFQQVANPLFTGGGF